MPDKKDCFIIMPITTPESLLSTYRDGSEHFKHVLDCLFIPAIEKAGFKPQPPIARGSDLIHAEVIKSLESVEILLCDMSTLNPNVFFEFGIRTSLNKPVCVVKDEKTTHVPFDTGIINYKEYNSAIEPWNLTKEIEIIAEHLTTSVERSKGENTLWKYFGIRKEAVPYKGEDNTESKLEYITFQLASLRDKIESESMREPWSPPSSIDRQKSTYSIREIHREISGLLPASIDVLDMKIDDRKLTIHFSGELSNQEMKLLSNFVRHRHNLETLFIQDDGKTIK